MQVSQRENKAGCETQTEALKIVAKVIAAGLHRIAQAMGQDSECISKASKVWFMSCNIFTANISNAAAV